MAAEFRIELTENAPPAPAPPADQAPAARPGDKPPLPADLAGRAPLAEALSAADALRKAAEKLTKAVAAPPPPPKPEQVLAAADDRLKKDANARLRDAATAPPPAVTHKVGPVRSGPGEVPIPLPPDDRWGENGNPFEPPMPGPSRPKPPPLPAPPPVPPQPESVSVAEVLDELKDELKQSIKVTAAAVTPKPVPAVAPKKWTGPIDNGPPASGRDELDDLLDRLGGPPPDPDELDAPKVRPAPVPKSRPVVVPPPLPPPTPKPVPPPLPLPPVGGGGGGGGPPPLPAPGPRPRATPVGSPVPVFDRPQPVIVVGPKPLPVTMTGGGGRGGESTPPTNRRPNRGASVAAQTLNWTTQAFHGAGQAGAGVAQGQVMPAFTAAVNVASAGLSKLGPYGMVAAAGLQTVSAAAQAVKGTFDALAARGKELQNYSGAIAGASAQQDVTRILTDIREAQRMGDRYAELIQKQTEVEETFRAMLLPIKERLIDALIPMMDMLLNVTINVLDTLDRRLPGKTVFGEMVSEMREMREMFAVGGAVPGGDDLIKKWTHPVDPAAFGPAAPGLPAPPRPPGP